MSYIAIGIEKPPIPIEQRKHREIACLSWTSSTGEITPLSFKMLVDGEVQTFKKLRILNIEEKWSFGTTIMEFKCEMIVNGFKIKSLLVLDTNKRRWYLVDE